MQKTIYTYIRCFVRDRLIYIPEISLQGQDIECTVQYAGGYILPSDGFKTG